MNPKTHAHIQAFPGEPVTAFFSTRLGGVSPPPYDALNLGSHTGDTPENVTSNWNLLLKNTGLENRRLFLPNLVHGCELLDADAHEEDSVPEADAVYSRSLDTILAVTAADCLPILLYDPATHIVAAIHAGWRGTRSLILEITLKTLSAKNLIQPATTKLAFGPCLQANRLEIGLDIAATLPGEHVRRDAGRATFDIPGANYAQALRAGLNARHINICSDCTWDDPERFFSHRRDKGVTGRMAGIIALEA